MKVDLLDLKIATFIARRNQPDIGTQVKSGKIQVARFEKIKGKNTPKIIPTTDFIDLGQAIIELLRIGNSTLEEMISYREKVTLTSRSLPQ